LISVHFVDFFRLVLLQVNFKGKVCLRALEINALIYIYSWIC